MEYFGKLSAVLILVVFLLKDTGKYNYFPVSILLKSTVNQMGILF